MSLPESTTGRFRQPDWHCPISKARPRLGQRVPGRVPNKRRGAADTVGMSGKIDRDSATFARPALDGRLGEAMVVKADDGGGKSFARSMVVREVPAPPAQP
jgi:hypothetical protein